MIRRWAACGLGQSARCPVKVLRSFFSARPLPSLRCGPMRPVLGVGRRVFGPPLVAAVLKHPPNVNLQRTSADVGRNCQFGPMSTAARDGGALWKCGAAPAANKLKQFGDCSDGRGSRRSSGCAISRARMGELRAHLCDCCTSWPLRARGGILEVFLTHRRRPRAMRQKTEVAFVDAAAPPQRWELAVSDG